MSDAAQLDDWQPKFESWVEFAKPLLPQGKAREAFAEYPWFTTVGDPFVTLSKPASECRFGLVTTGGYSIDGEQETFTGLPTFGDEVPEFRKIPTDVDRSKLVINHHGYDHKYAKFDAYAFGTRASPDDAYRFCIELKPDFKIVIAANVPR